MAETAKTATKFAKPSPRSGVALPLGNHPGNTGGKKGRSGRKPEHFYERARELANDPQVWDVQLARARSGDLNPLKLAAEYTFEKPTEKKEITGDVTFRVVYDD